MDLGKKVTLPCHNIAMVIVVIVVMLGMVRLIQERLNSTNICIHSMLSLLDPLELQADILSSL